MGFANRCTRRTVGSTRTMRPSLRRITAPRPIEQAAPYRFPLVTSLAPVVASLALFGLTGSTFALVFAALGPVAALASLADARWGRRRLARREERRFAADLSTALNRVTETHAAERAALADLYPSTAQLVASRSDPDRWTATGDIVAVRLGRGVIASTVEVDGAPADDPRYETLIAHAARVHAPVWVDARLGIGIVGRGALAQSIRRSVIAQLSRLLSPLQWRTIVPDGADDRWMLDLPHPSRTGGASAGFESIANGETICVATAEQRERLPLGCRIVITAEGGEVAIVAHPDPTLRTPFTPEFTSLLEATAWAHRMRVDAEGAGMIPEGTLIPAVVRLADLLNNDHSPEGLSCYVGAAREAIDIDLVRDGPHAVVGGTTGSGKSELLVSWVLAIAHAHPPSVVTVLLVDFKGGSAFSPLERLPHTVGVITDLDAHTAARALASLRAELRHRERVIAVAGARDIRGVTHLPRLVIVVDEFAAMLAEYPDLHALFADISSRGRSLGVHLILCTQRPAGIVRDAVLANADLRISLRVNNRSDSVAVVGDDSAANIQAAEVGRGVLVTGTHPARTIQFALADDADVARVLSRWSTASPVRRPWCEPLPTMINRVDVPAEAFGVLDQPELQRHALARWNPHEQGTMLVLGAQSSGTSTALAALAYGFDCVEWVSSDPVAAWDTISAVYDCITESSLALPVGSSGNTLVVMDDADALLARFTPEHRAVVVERLVRIVREGPTRGIHMALSARRVTADLQAVASLASARLLLAHANKQDWVVAGGEGSSFVQQAGPGAGMWGDHRVQVVSEPVPHPSTASPIPLLTGGPLAIVAAFPAGVARRFAGWRILAPADLATSSLEAHTLVIADPDEWQSHWGALHRASRSAKVVILACSTTEFRALTRSRDVPPPLPTDSNVGWLVGDDGRASRVRLPETMDSAQ